MSGETSYILGVLAFLVLFLVLPSVASAAVYLISPPNGTYTNQNNDTLQFVFNHTGSLTGIVNCTLYIDSIAVNYTENVPANEDVVLYSNKSWSEGEHFWYVNCTNETAQESSLDTGDNFTFIADFTAPNITSWFTNATNASSPQDLMFLVVANETILFNITVNETHLDSFVWMVNKVDQNNNASNFTFSVPCCNSSVDPSECIWEIHVMVNDSAGNEAHQEWVISTLNESEAPDIFDYFTDKKIRNRTETDPWGRALPEWSGSLVNLSGWTPTTISECSIKAGYVDIRIPSSITEGTWIFRYKFKYSLEEQQGGGHVKFYPIYKYKTLYYSWEKCWDAHHHCVIGSWLHGEETDFSMDYDGAATYEDGKWHKVVLIRKGNYFYAFKEIKHKSLPESKMMLEFHAYEPLDNISEIRIYMRDMGKGCPSNIDDIQVYKGKYLFPYNGNIYVGNYFYDHWHNGEGLAPLWKEGIIVQGRNNTLKDIAKAINNSSIFYYDDKTKTAICYKDLVLDEGAELIIKNETLKFHSTYDGELAFVLDYGSRLYVENSTITSDTQYYWVWNNAGSTTHWSNELVMYMDPRKTEPSYGILGWSGHTPLDVAYHGEFIIKNSTIDNFAHLFLDSPYEVNITDSKFTNIHEIDIGLYNPISGSWSEPINFCKGNKSIWIYTDAVNVKNFIIRNVTFSGAEHPLNFTFLLNAHRDKYNIYDLNAEDDYIIIKESMAETGAQAHSCYIGGSSGPWGRIYSHNSYIASELGLVNCKFKDILITPGIFTDEDGRKKQKAAYVKYYLDVKVVDKDGNSVPNANVSVNVEQDWTLDDMKTNHYPVENMIVEKPYAVGNYNCLYHHYRWIDGQPLNRTYTTATGHTPLPSEDPAHTLIIVDYKRYRDIDTEEVKQENYTYTITASYNGKTASLSGLDIDESWYRENPDVPTKTVVCNIDSGNCWIEGEVTGTLKGKVTDEDGVPIEGAIITANSHQTTTNSSGDYIMSLPVGNYTVTASKEGYLSNTTTAEILENQTTILNFTLKKLNVTVTAPANKWTSFRMHPSYNLTFEQISANLTNHLALSYYNKSIGLWQSYWVGYDFNKNVVVSERESLFAYFSAETNLSCDTPSPKAKPLKADDTTPLYLRGYGNKKIEEIKAALESDGCIVVQICGWDKINQEWNCTDDFVVYPSEGFIVQTSNNCVWREIV